jgi:hypothetical protein
MSRTRGCDYITIHTGLVASSSDDGAAIIEVHATPLPDFGIRPGVIRCFALLHQPGREAHNDRSLEKTDMSRLKILSAAAIPSMMIATPVFAQAVIQEPGAFAFYHPNADVLNAGRPTAAETAGARTSVRFGSSDAYASMDGDVNTSSCAERYRSYDRGSGTFLGYDGTRHACK